MIAGILLRSAARFHLREPFQLILSITGIALGVAVFVGVDAANTSATAAFQMSADFVRGAATHRLLPAGDSLDEDLFFELIAARGIVAAPIIELPIETGGTRNRATLLGVDPVEEARFRETTRLAMLGGASPAELIAEPHTAIASASLVEASDETLTLATRAGTQTLRIVGVMGTSTGAAPLVVVDIATAQEVAGMLGKLTRIDLILDDAQTEELRRRLPGDVVLVRADSQDAAFVQLSNAFRINVLALGLLALAIGMFLVYSSAAFSLVRRANTHTVFNVLGAGTVNLALVVTLEFFALGVLASIVGVTLGHSLARALVDMMLFTIEDFSFRREAAVGAISSTHYAQGLLIGVAATLVAAIGPIRHAMQRDTAAALRRSSLEMASGTNRQRALKASVVLSIAAVVLLAWPGSNLIVAFAGLFAILAAAACAAPTGSAAIVALVQRLSSPDKHFVIGLSARNVAAQQSRVAVAIAALTLAVSCVIGVGIMISSFRASLQSWLDTTLTADIYINFAGEQSAAVDALDFIERDDRVESFSLTRFANLPTDLGTVAVRAFRPGTRGWGVQMIEGDAGALDELSAGTSIAITEPFALRTGLTRGDALTLPGINGSNRYSIAAVYRNYDAGGASVLMDLDAFSQLLPGDEVDGIGLEIRSVDDVDRVQNDIRRLLPASAARITNSTAIRQISVQVFDRTFLITEVLRVIAGSVAFLGMLSALMAIQVSRKREFAILRTLGFDPGQLRKLILTETAIIGSSAGLLALPLGIVLAALLIYVINIRSFGWTMGFEIDVMTLALGFVLALTAALLAGVFPALISRRLSIPDALRH